MRKKSTRSGRQTIRKNAAKGAAAERRVARKYRKAGYSVKQTGIGHDFMATKRSKTTGKMIRKRVEVKSGNAKLSKRQRAAKRKHGRGYVVERA